MDLRVTLKNTKVVDKIMEILQKHVSVDYEPKRNTGLREKIVSLGG